MSIKTILKSTVAALAFASAGPLFAQGTPIDTAAFDAIVARGPVADAALDALCHDHIARFKRPKDYVFVEALPKNNYGKTLKTELRVMDGQRNSRATG